MLKNLLSNMDVFGENKIVKFDKDLMLSALYSNGYQEALDVVSSLNKKPKTLYTSRENAAILVSLLIKTAHEYRIDSTTTVTARQAETMLNYAVSTNIASMDDLMSLVSIVPYEENNGGPVKLFIVKGLIAYLTVCNQK